MALIGILGIQYLANMYYFCNVEYLLWKNVNTRDTRQSWFVSKNNQKSKYELIPVTQTVYQVRMIRRLLRVLKYT